MATVGNLLTSLTPSVHNGVIPRWQLEIQRPGHRKQWLQQWTIFTCLGLSEAASGIEHGISWSDVDQQIDEYGDDYDEFCEDDVEWHTGDCDDGMEESAYTVGPPTNDP